MRNDRPALGLECRTRLDQKMRSPRHCPLGPASGGDCGEISCVRVDPGLSKCSGNHSTGATLTGNGFLRQKIYYICPAKACRSISPRPPRETAPHGKRPPGTVPGARQSFMRCDLPEAQKSPFLSSWRAPACAVHACGGRAASYGRKRGLPPGGTRDWDLKAAVSARRPATAYHCRVSPGSRQPLGSTACREKHTALAPHVRE